MERKYTKEEIKRAYWETFHKSGENWFDYLSDEAENEESTRINWTYFKDNLENPHTVDSN